MEKFFVVTLLTVGRFSHYKRKSLQLRLVAQPRTSCRSLLKQLEILPLPRHFILSLKGFIINNQEKFQTNSSKQNINTRNKHLPCFQKRTFYGGIKIFNSLPPSLTILKNDQVEFRAALRKYLNIPRFTLWLIFVFVKIIYNTAL